MAAPEFYRGEVFPAWRRTVWQTCVIALLAVAFVECFGGAQWLAEAALPKFFGIQFLAKANLNSSVWPGPTLQLNPEFRSRVAERIGARQQLATSVAPPQSSSSEQISAPLVPLPIPQSSSPKSEILSVSR